jgi:hypothetical protein
MIEGVFEHLLNTLKHNLPYLQVKDLATGPNVLTVLTGPDKDTSKATSVREMWLMLSNTFVLIKRLQYLQPKRRHHGPRGQAQNQDSSAATIL